MAQKPPIRRYVPVQNQKPKEQKKEPIKEEKSGNSFQGLLILIPLLLLGGIALLMVFRKDIVTDIISGIKGRKVVTTTVADSTASEISDSSESLDDVVTVLQDHDLPKPGKKTNKSIIPVTGDNYYLIAGTFIFYPYAEKFRDEMRAQGYSQAEILTSKGDKRNFYRIYLETSPDGNAIRERRNTLRDSKGLDVWVYAE